MNERPIDPEIRPHAGAERDPAEEAADPGVPSEEFRDALSEWATGVTIVAVRDPDDGRVYAATVSSFASVSAEPPRILISLGPGAQPLPFLQESPEEKESPEEDVETLPVPAGAARFVVNILSAEQSGLAQRFTDPFPVGRSPFPVEGDPVIEGGQAVLVCRVERVIPVGSCRLVVGRVVRTRRSGSAAPEPLLRHRRGYRSF